MVSVAQLAQSAALEAHSLDGDPLLATAQGCRASNLSALDCAPELYTLFPSSTADVLASVMVQTWGCELSSTVMTTALTNCKKADQTAAYTAADISGAVAANISLNFLDSKNVPTKYGLSTNDQLKMIGLSQGNLVAIKPAEKAMFLCISCLPGDYAPIPGSLIAAINSAYGINVATLAQNKAADYLSTNNCWVSQELSQYHSGIPYERLMVFESNGSDALNNVPGIFTSIKTFVPDPPAIPNTGPTIISGMVSTGSAGASATGILSALYTGAYDLMTGGTGYNMTCFRIVNFQTSWNQQLITTFNGLKG